MARVNAYLNNKSLFGYLTLSKSCLKIRIKDLLECTLFYRKVINFLLLIKV